MAKLSGNQQLLDSAGNPLFSLKDINALPMEEKKGIYGRLLPARLYDLYSISVQTFCGVDGQSKVNCIAPKGLGLLRLEVKLNADDRDTVFFLEIADTYYHQMELAFCVIKDLATPRFDVDVDVAGSNNYFATMGRNIPEEIKAMNAGLMPNQTHRGLRLFAEFFSFFEKFVDSLGIDIILAEPLTYDNAIRYEKYGFDYITGKQLMLEINEGFKPGNALFRRLDGSSPFRMPGMDKTLHGRSWAIHDGILNKPWNDIIIYKMIGNRAEVNTFPEFDRLRKAG
jgi:hypothetical protein